LEAAFASYYTNRQNEQAAFAELSNQLFAWQNALQATTRQLSDEALATMGDYRGPQSVGGAPDARVQRQ